jgi:simple sugar transport system ATP-binding protein
MHPVLQARGITKRYGHVEALRGADFDVYPGEIVALIGDNGAGKSTLIKNLTGVVQPDEGEITMDGTPVSFESPARARELGVEVVHQDLGLAPDLNPAENVYLGREILKKGVLAPFAVLDKRAMRQATERHFATYGLKLQDPNSPVSTLSGGQKQSIAVIKAVADHHKVVFMDEPTAALGVEQTGKVLEIIRRVRDEGSAVVLISHDIPRVLEIADRIQVLRTGRRVADIPREEATLKLLVDVMAGVEA